MQPKVDAVRRPLLAVALLGVALACTTSVSAASDQVVQRGDRGEAVRQVQSALGVAADGVFGPQTERAVKRFQRSKGLTVDGVVGPQTRDALGLRSVSSRSRGSVPLPRVLHRIATCESGGNPTAVSPGGTHRGKYQFSRATWRALGGTGDPAEASEALQDRLALRLYRRSGTAAWPNCP